MRVVVTGGAGFLGSHLCERLLADGHDVVCADNLLTGRREHVEMFAANPRYAFQHVDVSKSVYVEGAVDAVMHFASPASPVDYLQHPIPTLKVGALGTHNALGLAKAKGARFMLASTSEVYGDPQVHPQPETYWGHVNPIGPRGVYDEAKRFAEAMTMAYHRAHGLDTRIVRIFNSILSDEQVLYDDGTELRRETIGELAARLTGVDLDGYRVPAFDVNGRVTAAEAIALVGHPPNGPCYELSLRYGRSIRVTGDHSIFVETPEGPRAKPVSQLQKGERVAIAAKISVPERDRSVVRMTEVWDAAGRDPWDILVESPELGDVAWSYRFEIFGAMARAGFGARARMWRSAIWGRIHGFRIKNQLPLAVMRKLGIPIAAQAHVRLRTSGRASLVPERIEISDELLWLLGLLVAEGCLYENLPKSSFVSVSCSNDLLERAAKIFERDLNLHVVWSGGSDQRAPAIFVHSQLLLALLRHLGFDAGPKRIPGWVLGLPLVRLKWFIEGYREGDGVHSGSKFTEGVRHEFSTTSEALKDDLVVAFARFGLVPSVGRYETRFRKRTGDCTYPFWRLTLTRVAPWSPLEWDGDVAQVLQARRWGDLVWAAVRDVREVPPTEWVYDFCVPGRENFWAGTGVMAHNTYGPRMRPKDGRAIPEFISAALESAPLPVHGDGSQTRSFCYVEDEVEGFIRLLESDEHDPVNIGNPFEMTVLDLAKLVIELTGSKSEIEYLPRPVDDPNVRRPDITRARTILGWEPHVPPEEGLKRTIEWFRAEKGR